MFERYNIDKLFIAFVDVTKVVDNEIIGSGYITILRKIDDNRYVDLNNLDITVLINKDKEYNNINVYTVSYIEPLSDYYTQDGKVKFSKKQAINESSKYYNEFNHKRLYRK